MQGFDARERAIIALALRYWRSHRAEGQTRPGDPEMGAEAVDQLLAKLGSAPPRIPGTPPDSLAR